MSLFSKQIDKRIAAYQRELIETHYREVENMYRQIRGWRHDYRNHIQTMKVLAANGDMDAIKAYLDELDTDLNTVDTVVKTGRVLVLCPIRDEIIAYLAIPGSSLSNYFMKKKYDSFFGKESIIEETDTKRTLPS